ncbi:reverse transcriptase domain-containing protein [Tanacetum coccineum]
MLRENIAETFDNLRRINMKLNLKKCSFGVEEGKFLGYMVTSEGIQANPKKNKALTDMQSPRTLKEMQSLSEKLVPLNCFLERSVDRSLPFFNIQKNITKENKDEYNRTLNEAEKNYAPMEKLTLSLLHMTRRLRRYFKAHPIKVITDQPIKQIFIKTEALGKLAKYVVELGAYNITYEPRNAIKGQVLADFLSETPSGESAESYFRTPEIVPKKDDTEA